MICILLLLPNADEQNWSFRQKSKAQYHCINFYHGLGAACLSSYSSFRLNIIDKHLTMIHRARYNKDISYKQKKR